MNFNKHVADCSPPSKEDIGRVKKSILLSLFALGVQPFVFAGLCVFGYQEFVATVLAGQEQNLYGLVVDAVVYTGLGTFLTVLTGLIVYWPGYFRLHVFLAKLCLSVSTCFSAVFAFSFIWAQLFEGVQTSSAPLWASCAYAVVMGLVYGKRQDQLHEMKPLKGSLEGVDLSSASAKEYLKKVEIMDRPIVQSELWALYVFDGASRTVAAMINEEFGV